MTSREDTKKMLQLVVKGGEIALSSLMRKWEELNEEEREILVMHGFLGLQARELIERLKHKRNARVTLSMPKKKVFENFLKTVNMLRSLNIGGEG